MFRKLTFLSFALLSLPFPAGAESAGEYLHRGAQKYIFGEKEKAKAEVTTGLEKYPGDEPLQQLLALFREDEKKDQKSEDQQKEKDQKDQKDEQSKDQQGSQSPKDQKEQDQQKQDGQKEEQPKDGQQEPKDAKDGESGKPEPKDAPSAEPKDGKEGKDGAKPEPMPGQEDKKLTGEVKAANPSPEQQQQQDKEEKEAAEAMAELEAAAEGKMTERQAKALLESLKSEDEKVRLIDPNERKRSGRVLRDW